MEDSDFDDEKSQQVNVGDRFTVRVKDIGAQGDAIAKLPSGPIVIIKATDLMKGTKVDIEITKVCEKYAFAVKV